MLMIDKVRERAEEFDILHFHIDLFQFPLFRSLAARTLTTLHGRQDLGDLKPFYSRFGEMPLVSISNDQRKPLPHANFVATIHHGIPVDLHRPSFEQGSYLAFLGRISPEKRPDRAIRIARAAGVLLKIAAKVDKVDEDYFRNEILPLIDGPDVEFIGEINEREKTKFLGEAAALLFPVDWPEPFGLVMIEAMACGTPVLAFRCGRSPRSSRTASPARLSNAKKKRSRRCRKSCLTIDARCGDGSKTDLLRRGWPKIMSAPIANCGRRTLYKSGPVNSLSMAAMAWLRRRLKSRFRS